MDKCEGDGGVGRAGDVVGLCVGNGEDGVEDGGVQYV